jgi:hypothetical protein
MARRKTRNYVNNPDFYIAMIEYKKLCIEAEESGEPIPVVTDYIAKCIHDISNRLALKPNFISYPFRDEMVADGLENALLAIKNFNPDKSKNPFAYFTQIIYFAFLRRIAKEKKQLYIKFKMLEKQMNFDDGSNPHFAEAQIKNHYMADFIRKYEEGIAKKKEDKRLKDEEILKFEKEKEDNQLDDFLN